MSQDRPFVSTFIPFSKKSKKPSKPNMPPPVVYSTINKRPTSILGTPLPAHPSTVTHRRKTVNNFAKAQISKYVNTARKKGLVIF